VTPEEKFTFDLEGYLVIRDVLSTDKIAELVRISNEKFPTSDNYKGGQRSDSDISQWGIPFQSLIDHPKVVPYLVELLGPKFRLDHDYCIFMNNLAEGDDQGAGGLHGGEVDHAADHWYKYRDAVMRNGLSVVTYCLSTARDGDGGFACIPGSHKSNFISSLPKDIRTFKRPAHYVVQPEYEAGDAIFFTEALIHGTMPWRAEHERRSFLYKYSPGHSAWSNRFYDLSKYNGLTEQQKRILTPPSVGGRPKSLDADANA